MVDASQHWLWRLDAGAWLASAEAELEQAQTRRDSRRAALTHARRAAGMALNAVLVAWAARDDRARADVETIWGRSYMDHLRVVAAGAMSGPLPATAAATAQLVLSAPVAATPLVQLRASASSDLDAALQAAADLVELCRATV